MRRKGKLLAEVQRIISEAREEGAQARAAAPNRSTGIRRQYQASHEAVGRIGRLLDLDSEES